MNNNMIANLIVNEHFFSFILFLSTCIKFYRVLFYLRIMLEFLPLYNAYQFPISLVYFATAPISKFYENFFPSFSFPFLTIDPTIYITAEIFTILIDFTDDIKDACAQALFS